MPVRGIRGEGRRPRRTALAVASLVALTALAPAAADAKKKKKKGKPAVTRTASVPFTQASNASATATCPKGTRITGGGFTVSPSFTPPSTGLFSLNSTSHSSGARTWSAGGSTYANPQASGSFTAVARCEKSSRGGRRVSGSSQATLQPGEARNLQFNCPPGSHVLNGGYAGTSLASFAFQVQSARIVVMASRRTGTAQWTITAFNNADAPAPANLTGFATCEENGKKRAVSEASAVAQINDNGRTTADATCSGKKLVVGGGFVITPLPPGSVPFASVDESAPVGKRGWHIGLHELVPYILPPGSGLQAIAYCKKV